MLKVAELVVFQRMIHWYWGLPVNGKEEIVDIIVFIMIFAPFTYVVLKQKKSMKEAEDKYRVLAEDSLIGIYTIMDDKFIYANQQFSEITGYSRDELIGLNVLDLVHPDEQ